MKKVVFIVGAGHCGSTLLDLILGSHSSGFSLAEFRVLPKLIEAPAMDNSNICVLCDGACSFWDHQVSLAQLAPMYLKATLAQKIKRKIARLFSNPYELLFKWSGKNMLIDSSKIPYWCQSQLSPAWNWKNVTPYLIYLQRDGRAVVNSYLRKYPEKGIDRLTKEWLKSVSDIGDYYTNFPFRHKTSISYEQIAKNPEQNIQALCKFLDIPYEKEMLLYWQHDHHPIAGNGGTQSLILKNRELASEAGTGYREELNQDDQYYQQSYYDALGLAIKFDERWRRELSDEQLSAFDKLAGTTNAQFTEPGDQ